MIFVCKEKLVLVGVVHNKGVSKKTGKDYDMIEISFKDSQDKILKFGLAKDSKIKEQDLLNNMYGEYVGLVFEVYKFDRMFDFKVQLLDLGE